MSHVCTRKLSSWSWRRRGRFTTTTPFGCNVKRESWERKAPGLLPAQPSKSTGRLRKTDGDRESRQDHQPTLAKLPWPTLLTRGRQCDTTRSRGCFLNTDKAVCPAGCHSQPGVQPHQVPPKLIRREARKPPQGVLAQGHGLLVLFLQPSQPTSPSLQEKTNFVACPKQRSPPQPWYFDPGRSAIALPRG